MEHKPAHQRQQNADRTARIKAVAFLLWQTENSIYKLIFKAEEKGRTATILGYDQQVRFGSMAK